MRNIIELASVAWRAHRPEVMSSFVLHDLMLLDTILLMLLQCMTYPCALHQNVQRKEK